MQNYWLSEYNSDDEDKYSEDPETDQIDDEEQSEDEPKSKLNARQKMMYEQYEESVSMHGLFDKTALGNGSHYAPAIKNPFIKEGLICSNCVFFQRRSRL
jgi:hypothetical protein